MTNEPHLGDIVVNGQRRRDGFSFSFPDPPTAAQMNWRNHTGQGSGGTPQPRHPCTLPGGRREWNADAIAAEAKREFERVAATLGDQGLYEREFGAQIYQRTDGSMYLGPVTYGDRRTGTFDFDETLATSDNLVGEIHTHPSPQMEPSVADWARLNYWSEFTGNNFRSYIVSRDPNNSSSDFAIRVYDVTSDQSSDAPGPEVNPEGQPCP